ncbi:hypothetical protein QBC45DRAFT_471805 [Copromyces sp. CBS 386.78]|nr:hypothetical protein QBC45DRAFT_471805 [Copromyces sp. CBS 386.78]
MVDPIGEADPVMLVSPRGACDIDGDVLHRGVGMLHRLTGVTGANREEEAEAVLAKGLGCMVCIRHDTKHAVLDGSVAVQIRCLLPLGKKKKCIRCRKLKGNCEDILQAENSFVTSIQDNDHPPNPAVQVAWINDRICFISEDMDHMCGFTAATHGEFDSGTGPFSFALYLFEIALYLLERAILFWGSNLDRFPATPEFPRIPRHILCMERIFPLPTPVRNALIEAGRSSPGGRAGILPHISMAL